MKNSLQLQLQLKIKRANRFLTAKQYSDAIKQYTEGLQLYEQNRRYNNTVSQQFQSLLYSLRGNTYSLDLNSELAQEDFGKSLNINPYNSVTLSRRAKHFMKEKKFSQAIQDIDLALLYDPENLSYLSLLNSIQNYVNQIVDQQQKRHISSLIAQVKNRLTAKPPTESQSQQEDDQDMLNFSKLKKIDRKSIKQSPKLDKLQKRKSTIQFKQDQILLYENNEPEDQTQDKTDIRISSSQQIQQKLKQQEEELKVLEVEEQQIRKSQLKIPEQFVLKKSHDKSRKSILRRSSINTSSKGDNMIFISTPGEKSNFSRRSSISAASIKDIDGKIVVHQNEKIKFRPSMSQLSKSDLGKIQEINCQEQRQNLTKTMPKPQKRKSCLRNSNRFAADEFQQLSKTAPNLLKRKSSNFLNIKSIDGQYHHKTTKQSSQQQAVNVKIQTESDDDDEHNIFGTKQKKQVLQVCDNMQELPQIIQKKLSKKKSILKKDSLLQTSQLQLSWKSGHKKSVLFKTG